MDDANGCPWVLGTEVVVEVLEVLFSPGKVVIALSLESELAFVDLLLLENVVPIGHGF
jgi:hypothetical protein